MTAQERPATPSPHPAPISIIQIVLGSVFGTGYIPIAPATFASLLALPLIAVLPRSVLVYAVVTAATFLLGVYLATVLERRWGKDNRHITIDELVGMLVGFFLVPFSIWSAIAGFLLFRFFDIVKLPFVRAFERLSGGWGVVMDDVMAGVCTNVMLQVVFRLIWRVPAPPWRMGW
jgi:phosphatidylglycerophosphatase A